MINDYYISLGFYSVKFVIHLGHGFTMNLIRYTNMDRAPTLESDACIIARSSSLYLYLHITLYFVIKQYLTFICFALFLCLKYRLTFLEVPWYSCFPRCSPWLLYSISQEICTRFLLCCALLWLYIDWFSHIHQAYFTGTVAIVRLPQCQQSNPDEYG